MVAKHSGLGRGLGDLFARTDGEESATAALSDGSSYDEIPVDEIAPNPQQPRSVFDDDELAELAQSISEFGVLQPIVVRRVEEQGYELIMGERRLRASRLAKKKLIPAIIRGTGDQEMLRDALLENLHRADLNPIEEARAYAQLLDDFGCTQEELSRRIHRSRPQVSNTLRLLGLPERVQLKVAAGTISAGHARALLGLADAQLQEILADRIIAEGLSVRSTEEIVAVGRKGGGRATGPRGPRVPTERERELAGQLSDHFDTRVRVDIGRSKGRITIEFASGDDLDRIMAILDGRSI